MKRFFILYAWIFLIFPSVAYSQVGEKVSSVKLLDMSKDTVLLPYLGEKNLLLFYADPGRPRQNKDFRDYFKTHPINSPLVVSYGIINLAAAPMIPNSLIVSMAKKELEGTDGKVYFDPDDVLSKAWKLTGADNNFAVIFVNKDRVIEFYKAGQLTPDDQAKVLALIKKYGQ